MRLYFTPLYIVVALRAIYLIARGSGCCTCRMLEAGGILNSFLYIGHMDPEG